MRPNEVFEDVPADSDPDGDVNPWLNGPAGGSTHKPWLCWFARGGSICWESCSFMVREETPEREGYMVANAQIYTY